MPIYLNIMLKHIELGETDIKINVFCNHQLLNEIRSQIRLNAYLQNNVFMNVRLKINY